MTQGVLPFKYENEKQKSDMTAFGGLPLYLDLAHVMGLRRLVEKNLGVRTNSQGWSDSEIIMSLILLNLSGGDCVEDLNRLESDNGFCRILERTQMYGMSRRQRRALSRRWRKEKRRSVPSPSSVFRYLSAFHDPDQEQLREIGKAFIPVCKHLAGFLRVNRGFLIPDHGHGDEEVQGFWHRHQHGLGWRSTYTLALQTLWKERRSP